MSSPRRPRQPLLAASMIVKNEADNLPVLLESIRELVDEIVVYDTGSTDATVEVARAHGARVVLGHWDDDFARARNAALDAVQAEWFLWVDGDDQVYCPAAQPLRAYLGGDASSLPGAPPPSRVDFVQVRVVNDQGDAGRDGHSVESVRIARRSTVRWSGRVHEQLKPIEGSAQGRSVRLAPELLHVRHRGYVDQEVLRAKVARNVLIAQAQIDDLVADGTDDPLTTGQAGYDLARSLLAAGRTQEAIEATEVVREIAADTVFWSLATLLLAQILLDNEGFEEAALFLADQLAADGRTSATMCNWLRAQALARTGRRREALELVRTVEELVDPVMNRYPMDRVLSARMLFAGAEGYIEESADTALQLVLDYGPEPERCRLLMRLWSGRLPELAAGVAVSTAPFRDETVRALAELDDAGRQVADLVRTGAHADTRARTALEAKESGQPDISPSSSHLA